jgi:endonuclease YncB( thermonuclease family)
MKRPILIFLIVAALLCCNFAYAQTKSFEAEVTRVLDGDSLEFRHADGNLDRVRLLGLDAPEVAHNSKEISQPFGEECRLFLQNLIAGKTVTVETNRRDNYGRNLARILTNAGEDVNLSILRQGCAWSYYPNGVPTEFRLGYVDAFQKAQADKIGLFSSGRAVTPKVWRSRRHLKRKRKTQ